jgi:NAD(P)-dependent dehydrogenase (short-subunit alcohol dehydrogenase family)
MFLNPRELGLIMEKNSNHKWALVTGASTGIGRAIAEYLAAHGFGVYAGARREEDLAALGSVTNVAPVKLDVTSVDDVNQTVETIKQAGTGLHALVNNAGIVRAGPLVDVTDEDMAAIFDVNFLGMHRISRAVFPLLLETKGRYVMNASDSGFFATPFNGPYCSSKFAMEGYADSLRREMLLVGIKVIIIEPGRVNTPIWDKGQAMLDQYIGSVSVFSELAKKMFTHAIESGKRKGLPPVEVAKVVFSALTSGKPKTRYLVAPRSDQFEYWLVKHMAAARVDKLVLGNMKKYQK